MTEQGPLRPAPAPDTGLSSLSPEATESLEHVPAWSTIAFHGGVSGPAGQFSGAFRVEEGSWEPAEETGGAATRDVASPDQAGRTGFPPIALESPLETSSAGAATSPGGPQGAGAALGYILETAIGRGGQGTVWSGWQRSLSREVAIKQYQGRQYDEFLREAYTTAALEHPNIIPVHDLGMMIDTEGRSWPLMAMKRLRGESWDRVLRREALAPGFEGETHLARHGGILLAVARAVAFAHARGVMHRDLKPSQVMIGDYGEAYLGDWGLALFLGDDLPRAMADGRPKFHTRDDSPAPAGSPAYMAPEQTATDNARLGPWTDVYQLGGILFEIIAGSPPHAAGNARKAFEAAERNEVRPLPGWCPPGFAAFLAACLATEPTGRPGGAEEFAARLKELLDGMAGRRRSMALAGEAARELKEIDARAGALAAEELYARRNAVARQLTQALALWPANAEAARLRERNLLDRTREEIHLGDLVLARVHLGDLAGPPVEAEPSVLVSPPAELAALTEAHGAELRRRRAVRRQRKAFAGLAALLFLVAVAFAVVAQRRAAEAAAGRAFAIARLHDAEELNTLLTTRLYDQLDLEQPGQLAVARAYAEAARDYLLPIDVSSLPEESQVAHGRSLYQFAVSFMRVGDLATALQLLDKAESLLAVWRPPHDTSMLEARSLEALLLFESGRVAEARDLFAELRPLVEAHVPPDSALRALHDHREGKTHLSTGRPELGLDLLRNAARVGALALAPDAPELSLARQDLAVALASLGQGEEALETSTRSLASLREQLGPEAAPYVNALASHGVLLYRMGRHEEARAAFADALPLHLKVFGPRNYRTCMCMASLASSLHLVGRNEESRRLFEEALVLHREVLGDHLETANTINNYALLLKDMDDSAGAEAAYQEALALNERLFGAGSSRVATVHHNLATLYAADRRWADTEAAASAALAIEEQLASGQYLFALSRMWRAKARASLGRFAEAAEDERLSNELRLRTYPPDDARVRASRSRRVLYLAAAGSWREALGERVQLHLSAGRLAAAPEAESRAARRDAALASLLLLGPEWDAMDAAGARAVTRRAWRVAQEESLAELAHDAARAGRLREYTLRVGLPALPILHRPAPTPRPSAP